MNERIKEEKVKTISNQLNKWKLKMFSQRNESLLLGSASPSFHTTNRRKESSDDSIVTAAFQGLARAKTFPGHKLNTSLHRKILIILLGNKLANKEQTFSKKFSFYLEFSRAKL